MRHFIRIFCVFKEIFINESLEYKGLLLIPMAGVIVSILSSNNFVELWRPEMRSKLSCYKKWEIFQLLHSYFRKPCPHFASVFTLHARRSFSFTAAGGLLAVAKAMNAPSNYIKKEIGFFIAITCNDVFDQRCIIKRLQQLCGPPLYTVGILGLKHHSSPTFHRRKPWQNLIDVAELDRNVTNRERSQQDVAGREET